MKPKLWLFLFALGLMLVGGIAPAFGQGNGTITGTVTDESGGVLPGADVAVINQATGDTRRTVTSEEGFFSVVALPAAVYTVEVEMPGFALWRRIDITLERSARINVTGIVLEVAGVADEITITSASDVIAPVDSGEKSATLSAEQIQDIPIVGRSAAELLRVLPGMAPVGDVMTNQPGFSGEVIGINGNGAAGKQSALGNYSANGTRSAQMNIVFDGGNVSDPGCNCATPVNPNPDMISEFKVMTSNYGAENAKGPVVIDAVSKAGSSEFHGTGYFIFRHWKLNSNEWELNKLGRERVQNKYYYPGFNIGGPLTPGRDKLFFFVGMEWMRQTLDTGVMRAVVPTQGMLNGDFSESQVSGLTAGASRGLNKVPDFPGGVIPADQIDPGGQVLLGLLPRPNTDPSQASGHNWVQALELSQPNTQQLFRIDYSISDNTKLFGRYNRQRETQPFVTTFWWFNANDVPYPSKIIGANRSDALSTSLTHVFSPTVTNETLFTLTFVGFPNTFESPDNVNRAKLGYPYEGINKNGILQIPSITSWGGGAATMLNPYFPGETVVTDPADANFFADKWMVSASDNFVKVAGTHTVKLGFFWEYVKNDQWSNNNSNGQIVYAPWHGLHTGNSYADILTGAASSFDDANFPAHRDMDYNTIEFYVTDSWKVNPRFTLDYGMRFAHYQPWRHVSGIGMAVWDPQSYDPSLTVSENYDTVTGVLWHAKDSSIPVSGAEPKGMFFMPRFGGAFDLSGNGNTVLRGGVGWFRFHHEQGFFAGTTDVGAGVRTANYGGGLTFAEIDTLDPKIDTKFNINALDRADKQMAQTISYSFTIQQRIPFDQMLEIGYVGNTQDYLLGDSGYWINQNAIPRGAMSDLPDPDSGNNDDFRPLQLYSNVNVARHNLWSNYNGLQVLLSRNAGRINYMASYTWSKALGIRGGGGGGGNCGDESPESCYGPLAFDRSHLFNISYSVHLPDTGSDNAVLRAIADGWQFTGISNYVSGGNLQTVNPNFGFEGTTSDGSSITNKNWLGTPDLTLQPTMTCDPRSGVTGDQIINPSCFAIPQRGQNGTVIMPYIHGPSYHNHDLSIFKNWNFSEDKRFQFRFSMFNFLNHPLKRLEDENLVLRWENGVMVNDRFGKYDDDPRKVGRRILQMGFKFFF